MNLQELKNRLLEIKDKLISIEQPSEKRIYLPCESENANAVCKFLSKDLVLRFMTVTGIDSEHYFEVLYHFANDQTGHIVVVKALIRDRDNPSIESITPFIPAAEWIERELRDILGIEVKNHPNMRRLILHDDWPEGVYPMRKTAVGPGEGNKK
jgi:NADH-quinone oxidoreductase subunit C